MLFTVSLQLTMTGHLSTSPSSISLACMLSGLCLLLSSLLFMTAFFTLFSPLLSPHTRLHKSLFFCNFCPAPFLLSLPNPLSIFYALPPPLLTVFLQSGFLCSLPPNFLALLALSLFHILHPLAPPILRPSTPSPPSLSLIVIEVH